MITITPAIHAAVPAFHAADLYLFSKGTQTAQIRQMTADFFVGCAAFHVMLNMYARHAEQNQNISGGCGRTSKRFNHA